MFLALYLAVALSALAVVRMRHEARQAQSRLTEAQQRAQDLAAEARQIELERATLAAPARIEALARKQLQMRTPPQVTVLPPEGAP